MTTKARAARKQDFTARVFAFLHGVNRDKRLNAVDAAVALELSDYFNKKDGGRAFPSCKTIGDAIGVHETTAIRSVKRLEAAGHLWVVWGSPGRGHPHQYWMAEKPAPAQVSDGRKPAPVQEIKPAPVQIKPAPAQENHLTNHGEGSLTETHSPGERETVELALDLTSPPGASAPLEGRAPEEGQGKEEVDAMEEAAASIEADLESGFAELRALWKRGWLSDDQPRAIAAQRRAYRAARQGGATHDEIMDGARAHVAAADALEHLVKLVDFIAVEGWTRSPPAKCAQRKSNGKPQRMTPGRAAANLLAEVREEASL
jgi:hypothetical protein